MRLSTLQKYILLQTLAARRSRLQRKVLVHFYDAMKVQPKLDDQQNSITKSLERMIDKGLLVGYGRRTPRKWFIEEIRLMPHGKKLAKKLQGEQQQLPLKSYKGQMTSYKKESK